MNYQHINDFIIGCFKTRGISNIVSILMIEDITIEWTESFYESVEYFKHIIKITKDNINYNLECRVWKDDFVNITEIENPDGTKYIVRNMNNNAMETMIIANSIYERFFKGDK